MWVFEFHNYFVIKIYQRVSYSIVVKSWWVKSWKMNINRKIYFYTDSGTSTYYLFALLDTVHSGNEDEICESINDSETESRAPEEIQRNSNPGNLSLLEP